MFDPSEEATNFARGKMTGFIYNVDSKDVVAILHSNEQSKIEPWLTRLTWTLRLTRSPIPQRLVSAMALMIPTPQSTISIMVRRQSLSN